MVISNRWQSRTALLLALGMTATTAIPILLATPATATLQPHLLAQLFPQQPTQVTPQSTRVRVSSGTVIPIRSDEAEKIVVTPNETLPVTLTVAKNIRSSAGTILIPVGSQVEGELKPVEGGTQFIAKELILKNSNRRLPIEATSEIITETETIDEGTDVGNIFKNAAIGAAAAAVLSEIFGDLDFIEVLAGAGLGALGGWILGGRKAAEVVVVYPETDLDLILESDLLLN
ncbi:MULTISPECIES: hypothetical protein [unclassified Coleofasciculus]|uniref:hypothetical protein n=1 Tax=unclassified Coleofasciculus TaxID=2692782 RepID=UPI001880A7DE|nr:MULTISPECIES: hypothetical protein [unclassified Coleofasciculus]MBE9125638.1 hypothetical protein [Coleofasciculus sp. LEGE 07081]MBE9148792.1 hypothetical protein [Coleofasciculus sp. LEGE 07092]